MLTESLTVKVFFLPVELNDLLGILFLFGLATLLKEGVLEAIINV